MIPYSVASFVRPISLLRSLSRRDASDAKVRKDRTSNIQLPTSRESSSAPGLGISRPGEIPSGSGRIPSLQAYEKQAESKLIC